MLLSLISLFVISEMSSAGSGTSSSFTSITTTGGFCLCRFLHREHFFFKTQTAMITTTTMTMIIKRMKPARPPKIPPKNFPDIFSAKLSPYSRYSHDVGSSLLSPQLLI